MTAPAVAPAALAEPPYRIHRYPSALIERVRLADGRAVIVRPVLPQDDEDLRAFVDALSPSSRRLRFHGGVRQVPAPVLRAMTSVDYDRHLALVAEPRCDDGPSEPVRLVAEARVVITRDDRAEFAVAVADDWQGVGLGRAMLSRLAQHARARGIARLEGSVLADNAPMLALVRKLGGRLRSDPDDAAALLVTIGG
jgi:acetyltransferase